MSPPSKPADNKFTQVYLPERWAGEVIRLLIVILIRRLNTVSPYFLIALFALSFILLLRNDSKNVAGSAAQGGDYRYKHVRPRANKDGLNQNPLTGMRRI